VDCGIRIADCGKIKHRAEVFEWGMRNGECGVRNAEGGMRNDSIVDCGIRIADCGKIKHRAKGMEKITENSV
jgi:hypothetical protein